VRETIGLKPMISHTLGPVDALAYLYLAFFAAAALLILRSDARAGAPPWKASASAVVGALGLAGMWVHLGGDPAPWLRDVWIFVLPILVAGAVLEVVWWFRRGFAAHWDSAERRDPQLRSLLWTSSLFAMLAFLPMLWMNANLAFGAP